jgi:3-carboxy-cis,cis-muconate cycloisomerase
VSALLWPGDHRAGDAMTDVAFLHAMTRVEQAWLRALAESGIAPSAVSIEVSATDADVEEIANAAEQQGNPAIPLVALLRQRLDSAGHHDAAAWLHRGLTSQDVIDTAMMICARDAVVRIDAELAGQVQVLATLVEQHRSTVMVARTITQPAVPTTFGAKAATWLHAALDAADAFAALRFPLQLGGAAGTLAGLVELGGLERTRRCRDLLGRELNLPVVSPWHTRRTAITRIGDAAVTATDAWGRIANDVLVLGRPEIGELAEGVGGGSSTMPNKSNPVMSVLIRRAALAAPQLAATLHLAAAEQVDERADGAWHVEWQTLALLLRRTLIAAGQTTSLLTGLRVDGEQMARRLTQLSHDVHAEQRALADLAGRRPATTYDGIIADLVDEALARARRHRLEKP